MEELTEQQENISTISPVSDQGHALTNSSSDASDEQLLKEAEDLLCLDDAELQVLGFEDVLQHVQQFRNAIGRVTSRLVELGDIAVTAPLLAPAQTSSPALQELPPLPPRAPSYQTDAKRQRALRESSTEPSSLPVNNQTSQKQQDTGTSGNELAEYGEEGVDYTLGCVDDLDPSEWQVPPHCIPIHANVVTFNWRSLTEAAQFDVIMMDPPWQLATANPTRGVALGYSQLCDQDIAAIPIPELQRNGGFLFVWVINARYKWMMEQFERWGYRVVDEVVWVKMTVNRRLAKSHGYYLQHAKEVCLVGRRGDVDPPGTRIGGVASDVIFSMRRGNSQKPTEIYELVEDLVPGGRYLEIFARKNNLRNFWVSLGNEVTGTGLPQEDLDAIRDGMDLPGAVYGRAGGKVG